MTINFRGLYPLPYERAWVSAYTDGTMECFEVRTVDKKQETPYAHIWHGEYPMGTALADFLYADLSTWDWHLEQIGEMLEDINRGADAEPIFDHLRDYVRFWLRESDLFAPVGAWVERLRLHHDAGEILSTAELVAQVAFYRDLQPRLLALTQALFETEDPTDLESKYIDLWRENKETYPALSYGRVDLQEVWKNGLRFSTYDDMTDVLDALDKKDKNEPIPEQEFFTTEVVSSEEPADLVDFMLVRYMRNNLQMKPCKYCGRYFATKRAYKTDYCDRLIDGSTKTCREAGAIRLYEKRMQEDPAVKEYKRSYKAHNARIRYGLMTREEFNEWSLEARKRRQMCLDGELSLGDFVAWLDSDKM